MSWRTRTFDGSSMLRCMVVALTPEQTEACRRALIPVEVVRVHDVEDAAKQMSTVLPLLVIVDEAMADADRTALLEYSTACGAELVTFTSGDAFDRILLDALGVAERRRLGAHR